MHFRLKLCCNRLQVCWNIPNIGMDSAGWITYKQLYGFLKAQHQQEVAIKKWGKPPKTRQSKKKVDCALNQHISPDEFTFTLFTNRWHLLENCNATEGRKKESVPLWKRIFLFFVVVVFVAVTNLYIYFYKASPVSENYFMLPCYYTNKTKSKFLHDVTCKPFVLK